MSMEDVKIVSTPIATVVRILCGPTLTRNKIGIDLLTNLGCYNFYHHFVQLAAIDFHCGGRARYWTTKHSPSISLKNINYTLECFLVIYPYPTNMMHVWDCQLDLFLITDNFSTQKLLRENNIKETIKDFSFIFSLRSREIHLSKLFSLPIGAPNFNDNL